MFNKHTFSDTHYVTHNVDINKHSCCLIMSTYIANIYGIDGNFGGFFCQFQEDDQNSIPTLQTTICSISVSN